MLFYLVVGRGISYRPTGNLQYCLTLVFVVEDVMKNIVFTPQGYWQSRRNHYDLLVTVLGVVWIFINTTLKVSETKSV